MGLHNFKLRWALKKIVRKLHGLIVPEHKLTGVVEEDWVGKTNVEPEEVLQSKWLLRNSDWISRIVQPIVALLYIIACWYISVDMVFGLGSHP